MRKKKKRKHTPKKTITHTRQYLHDSAICLHSRSCRDFTPLYGLSLSKSPIKNHATLFGSGWVIKPNQTKLVSTKPNKSPTWRLVQSPTSNRNPPKTIPHPCNSSSCPQARRPTETAHNFSFSMVTPLVNMSVRFLDPQIFSSITNLSSTR